MVMVVGMGTGMVVMVGEEKEKDSGAPAVQPFVDLKDPFQD
jgi:hypothetical protein